MLFYSTKNSEQNASFEQHNCFVFFNIDYNNTVFYNRYDNFSNTFNHFPKLLTQLAQHPSV